MTEVTAVSREHHAGKTWQRSTSWHFASKDPVAALVSLEIPRAMMSMAIGFVESEGAYVPVAVQGVKQGMNAFVSPDGRWLGDYVPAVYRAYPFQLGRNQDGAEVLCIDEAAGKVSENANGEPFFMPDGAPAKAVADAFNLLLQTEKDRQKTQKACETLTRHGLLEPWPLKMQDGEVVLEAKGLFRIAEAKLYALDSAALAEVRDSTALMIAFGQLFSMQQIHLLGKLGAPNRSGQQAPAVNLSEENGLISFANL